jgi:hypothetical protein
LFEVPPFYIIKQAEKSKYFDAPAIPPFITPQIPEPEMLVSRAIGVDKRVDFFLKSTTRPGNRILIGFSRPNPLNDKKEKHA